MRRRPFRPVTLTLACAVLLLGACASAPGRAGVAGGEAAVAEVLDALVETWNADSLDGHVGRYAADATYTSSRGLLRGRSAIRGMLAGAFQRADGLDGVLRFEDEEITMLGADHAMATGRFVLTRDPRPEIAGRFTLILSRTPDGWVVVHDHSS